MSSRKKILYFVTEDWYFCSHRLTLAKAAMQAGYAVCVLTRVKEHGDVIRGAGIELHALQMVRGGTNPVSEIKALYQIYLAYRRIGPDLVHHIALKPVIYGGLIAMFFPGLRVVNLVAGLGSIFSARNLKTALLRPFVKTLFRLLFRRKNTLTIVQNREDFDLMRNGLNIRTDKLKLIKGSGVDTERFSPSCIEDEKVSFGLVARMLWNKGIGEYVEAVKLLKQKGLVFTAYLVGQPDEENVASIDAEQLRKWQSSGQIVYLGHMDDIANFWRRTQIAVLPSYREGLPKSLLEAAASGRPIVATDTSGCKEVVDDGINGFLVPVKAVQALADAMEKLIADEALRISMGKSAREKVEREFSDLVIVSQTLAVYRELL
ncbi:MAG: glycosyltransferase family 4 protein [Gammaproteobacteria bacterium]